MTKNKKFIEQLCYINKIDINDFLWDLQLNKKLYFVNKEAKHFFITYKKELTA